LGSGGLLRMSTTGQLIFVNAWIIFWVWWCLANIYGRMADRTYDARMSISLRLFLMPGRLRDRAVWVRQQKVLAWVSLFVGVAGYVFVMIRIL